MNLALIISYRHRVHSIECFVSLLFFSRTFMNQIHSCFLLALRYLAYLKLFPTLTFLAIVIARVVKNTVHQITNFLLLIEINKS